MNNTRLSKNFTFFELTNSAEHPTLVTQNRIEAFPLIAVGTALAVIILQPIRDEHGKQTVDSGFRYYALNRAVGSKDNSQHRKFEAGDIKPKETPILKVFLWIAKSDLPFGQVILEPSLEKPTWIHVSLGEPWRPKVRCRQILVKRGNEYYTPDLDAIATKIADTKGKEG